MGRGSQQDLALAANSQQEGGRSRDWMRAGRQRATAARHALPHQMQIIDMNSGVPVRKWDEEEERNEQKDETISHQLFDSQPQL